MRSVKFYLPCIAFLLLSTSAMAGNENIFEGQLTIKNNTAYTLEMTDDRMVPDRGRFTFDTKFVDSGKQLISGEEKLIGEGKSKRNKTEGQFTLARTDTNSRFILKYRFGEKGTDTWAMVEKTSDSEDGGLPTMNVSMNCKKRSVGFTGTEYKHTCIVTLSDAEVAHTDGDLRSTEKIAKEVQRKRQRVAEVKDADADKRRKLLEEETALNTQLADLGES